MANFVTVIDEWGNPYLYPATLPPSMPSNWGYLLNPNNGQGVTNQFATNDTATGLSELATLHDTLLTQGQLVSTGTGDNMTSPLPTSIVRKPWLDAPDGFISFDPSTSIVLGAVGTQTIIITLVVPDGYDGVINGYSWNFLGGGFVDGNGDIQAQILRDGAAVRNYDNILTEKGTIGMARQISPLRLWSGQTIKLVVNHIANPLLNGNVIGSFTGYFYPSAG